MPTTSFHSASPDAIRTRNPRYPVDRIIIHTMQGSLSGTVAWFATPGRAVPTAAHYCVGEDGSIVQMVPDDKKALHAGSTTQPGWNDRSIGIEHAGFVDDGRGPPEAMLRASARVCAVMVHKFGIPVDRTHILGHVEVPGATHTDPGAEWPWEQYLGMVREEVARGA